MFKKGSDNVEKFDGCWWNKIDISLVNLYQKKFLINNTATSYVDLNDFFENYLLKQLNINRLKISDDFSFTQICKIISKGLKLESYESLDKVFMSWRKEIFLSI